MQGKVNHLAKSQPPSASPPALRRTLPDGAIFGRPTADPGPGGGCAGWRVGVGWVAGGRVVPVVVVVVVVVHHHATC